MIFYFSGSGNSEYIARRIASKEGDALVSIADSMRNGNFCYKVSAGEKVGFVLPVYYWGLPTVVAEFMEKLSIDGYSRQYTYTVISCGGSVAALPKIMDKILMQKGMHLDYLNSVYMVDTYITLLNLMTPADKVKSIETEAEVLIDDVIYELSVNKQGISKNFVKRHPELTTAVGQWIYKKFNRTKPFRVNDNCIGCGLCARLCPCSMISMVNNKPVWDIGHCSQCHACLNRCPVRAIDWGRKTLNRGRYVNPNV